MNRKTLILSILGLVCLVGTLDAKPFEYQQTDPVSYAEVDLSKKNAAITNPTGTSSVKSVKLTSTSGATYNGVYGACWLSAKDGQGITFTLNVTTPGMVQMHMEIASVIQGSNNSATYNIKVNGTVLPATPATDTGSSYHTVLYRIPSELINVGNNTIQLYLDANSITELFVRNVKFLPQKITSSKGKLTTTLYTQFGETDQIAGASFSKKVGKKKVKVPVKNIWTRAYGLSEKAEMIPGPTLYYKPGDLVSVQIKNLLNPVDNEVLKKFDSLAMSALNTDEILASDTLRGEINIPHNLNNTNLHVHGLHVDPSKDDVTIVIVPEGEDTSAYDAPHSHSPVSSLDSLNEYSVTDQSVKAGNWNYQYKIPSMHLPGTHWFHPHKHGSTSAQVENGLAGTMVIEEDASNALVPYPNTPSSVETTSGTQSGYNVTEWNNRHDRVLAIQEITNFGAQLGQGNGKGSVSGTHVITVNGDDSLVVNLRPGQLERWRLVNAGTNHKSFSHVWLGKFQNDSIKVGTKYARVFESAPMYLVAADGVTFAKKDPVTADNPALLAPGNRSDFLVQLNEPGEYVLFKNYNVPTTDPIAIRDPATGNIVFNSLKKNQQFWPAAAPGKSNPYLFERTSTSDYNYEGFTQNWEGSSSSIVPLIKTQLIDNDKFIDVKFAVANDFQSGATGLWQPSFQATGGLSDAELMYIHVQGDPVPADSTPAMPKDSYLATVSPVGTMDAPAYVSEIDPKTDILQSRPVVFDIAGLSVNVHNKVQGFTNPVNQFTLNGRFFILNDPIGNTKSDTIIQVPRNTPTDIEYDQDQQTIELTDSLWFVKYNKSGWKSNAVIPDASKPKDSLLYYMNPGYYQSVVENSQGSFSFDQKGMPSWAALTGLANNGSNQRTAAINTESTHYSANKSILPNLPLAKTAEEWYLINNSDVSHPFHIHINPFFVVEVGQLTYQQYDDAKGVERSDWFMKAVTAENDTQRPAMPAKGAVPGSVYQGQIGVDGIVGNWWDTITVPAHGYVKVRYWFNVPNQTESKSGKISVADNYNKTGIWVYHCHILRHEDRGMMMPVITRKTMEDD